MLAAIRFYADSRLRRNMNRHHGRVRFVAVLPAFSAPSTSSHIQGVPVQENESTPRRIIDTKDGNSDSGSLNSSSLLGRGDSLPAMSARFATEEFVGIGTTHEHREESRTVFYDTEVKDPSAP